MIHYTPPIVTTGPITTGPMTTGPMTTGSITTGGQSSTGGTSEETSVTPTTGVGTTGPGTTGIMTTGSASTTGGVIGILLSLFFPEYCEIVRMLTTATKTLGVGFVLVSINARAVLDGLVQPVQVCDMFCWCVDSDTAPVCDSPPCTVNQTCVDVNICVCKPQYKPPTCQEECKKCDRLCNCSR